MTLQVLGSDWPRKNLAGRAFIVDAPGGLEDLLQNEQRKLPRPVRERVRRPNAKRWSYLCTAREGRNRRRGLEARQRRTHRIYALPNAGSSSARIKGERRYTDSFCCVAVDFRVMLHVWTVLATY
ncbi:unnamed protein product [Scytosiphon promiscuus]